MGRIFDEFKRRNVFRVGLAYLALSWLILQAGAIVAPALNLPEWTLPFLIFILCAGFPIALVFAWAFELTPEGLKRSNEVDEASSISSYTGKRLNTLIIAILSLAVLALLADRFLMRNDGETVASTEVEAVGASGYESIAVLPFVNMSSATDQDYFSDGISEELLNLLAKVHGLRVAARTSSFAFKGRNEDVKDIGQKLDVETVLEGSVRRSGERLRITAQLIDAETGYHLWSETYDREMTDIFAIQDEISAAIVAALKLHLSGDEGEADALKAKVTSVEAYNAYLKGRHNIDSRNKERLYEALADLERATQLDPDYAPAQSAKGEAYLLLSTRNYGDIPRKQAETLAEAPINRALALDPNSADARAAKGLWLEAKKDLAAAEKELSRAIELSPNLARAYLWRSTVYAARGEANKEIADLEVAIKLDPLFSPTLMNLFRQYLERDRFDDAKRLLDQMKASSEGEDERTSFNIAVSELLWERSQGNLAKAFEIGKGVKEDAGIGFLPGLTFTAVHLENAEEAYASTNFAVGLFWSAYILGDREMALRQAGILNQLEWLKESDLPKYARGLALIMGDDQSQWVEAEKLLENLDDNFDGAMFGGNVTSTDAQDVIWAARKVGRRDIADHLQGRLRTYVDEARARGYGPRLRNLDYHLALMEGRTEDALAILQLMAERHEIYKSTLRVARATPLADRPEFRKIEENHRVSVNAERAKLGWPPIE